MDLRDLKAFEKLNKLKAFRISKRTLVLLAIAIVFFAVGLIMGSTASSVPENVQANASFGASGPAVVLHENGRALSDGRYDPATLSLNDLDRDSDKDTMVKPGKQYMEELTAENASSHDQYVRMIIRRYWTKGKGKDTSLSPKMIKLETGDGWKKSKKESTTETIVLYYTDILPAGEETPPAITGIKISNDVLDEVETENEIPEAGRTISKHEYAFDGSNMVIEVELQALQTHSPKSAIKSVWGNDAPKVKDDGTLKVK